MDEAKDLAWDRDNDNDYRQKILSIKRISFFHCEYLDEVRQYGLKFNLGLRQHILNEMHIVAGSS